MKIAISHNNGSFSGRWIEYCKSNNIAYKLVNPFDSDIIDQLKGCDALMWHHHQTRFKDALTAKRILFALEHAGIKVFPDFNTAWHFDDKVAQKYLLEAIGAPLVASYVFYDKAEAMDWARNTTYPKVFKLKGGAGSANVKLVKSRSVARALINRAFGRGFSQFDRVGYLKDQYEKYKAGKGNMRDVLRGVKRLFVSTRFAKMQGREKGYIYFQEFVPNNNFDIRVVVVDNKAFALKRLVRTGDFRASGSGSIVYDKSQIDENCVRIAFDINKKIKSQSIAFDFIFDENNIPLIVEISYGYAVTAYDFCEGYWDSSLNWHVKAFNPQEWMIESLIKEIKN